MAVKTVMSCKVGDTVACWGQYFGKVTAVTPDKRGQTLTVISPKGKVFSISGGEQQYVGETVKEYNDLMNEQQKSDYSEGAADAFKAKYKVQYLNVQPIVFTGGR